jgi:serine/threonine protein kinase
MRVTTHTSGGFNVAHKTFPKTAAKRSHDAYHREVTALTRCVDVPNVVRLLSHWEDKDAYHVVTRWCPGGTVPYDTHPMANRIVRDVACGLRDIHARDIVHADIKPANVVYDDVRFVLIDFEDARIDGKDPVVDAGALRGTWAFMAPETLRSIYGPASDVWALGVLACIVHHGVLPFGGADVRELWRGIQYSEPRVPPSDWSDLIRACLQKSPRDRPTAEELVREYDKFS